jgi:hypothetical protein
MVPHRDEAQHTAGERGVISASTCSGRPPKSRAPARSSIDSGGADSPKAVRLNVFLNCEVLGSWNDVLSSIRFMVSDADLKKTCCCNLFSRHDSAVATAAGPSLSNDASNVSTRGLVMFPRTLLVARVGRHRASHSMNCGRPEHTAHTHVLRKPHVSGPRRLFTVLCSCQLRSQKCRGSWFKFSNNRCRCEVSWGRPGELATFLACACWSRDLRCSARRCEHNGKTYMTCCKT